MENKKLSLSTLKVSSFVTKLTSNNTRTAKGGIFETIPVAQCADITNNCSANTCNTCYNTCVAGCGATNAGCGDGNTNTGQGNTGGGHTGVTADQPL